MEPSLKTQLTKAIDAVLDRKNSPDVRALLEIQGPNRYDSVPALILNSVRRQLKNANAWRQIHRAMLRDALTAAVKTRVRAKRRAASHPAQLPLPGFEHLPTRIATDGKQTAFADVTVRQFLAYKDRYEQRSAKNQRTVEDLRKLAARLQPFATSDLTVAEALARSSSGAVAAEA